MRKFYDIETEEVITEDALRHEYEALKNIGKIEGFADELPGTFGQYLANCLSKNGTLTEIQTTKNL